MKSMKNDDVDIDTERETDWGKIPTHKQKGETLMNNN